MTKNKIACDICGADRSRAGKPFDKTRLLKHKSIVHAAASANGKPIACDICGATQSSRGVPFLTMASVRLHKNKQHPEAKREHIVESAAANGSRANGSGAKRILNGTGQRAHHVKFCPQCGCNLEVVHAAIDFANGGGIS